jgi:hypothetical protein
MAKVVVRVRTIAKVVVRVRTIVRRTWTDPDTLV